MRLENARPLAFHIVWQLDDILSSLDRLVPHHKVEKRAEDAYTDGSIVALFVIEQRCEQVDQRGGQVFLFADVPYVRGIGIFSQVEVQYSFFKKLNIGLTVEFDQTR